MAGGSFFAELRRRKVLQSAAIYGAVAWGVTEIIVTVVEQLFLPQWISTLAVIFFVVGFPVAMFLSWTFDITSGGIKRTGVSTRRGTASIALSMALLVVGTAGLFFLIKPSIQQSGLTTAAPDILPNSVAVLPFENAGRNEADNYLSDGISDELRSQLGRVSSLRVAARSSSVAALERGMDALTASDSLRVAHLVEGSLRRQGNRLRISVQLIEGRTGLAVWSESFDRGSSELLSVQETIAEEIVRRILPPAVAATVTLTPATRDADANELMLLANEYDQQVRSREVVDQEALQEAIRLYREATAADPKSALAHSRLGSALLFQGDLDAAEQHVFEALKLDPKLSEVQNTLGEFYWTLGLPEARDAWERALELNPYDPDALNNLANLAALSYDWDTPFGSPEEMYQRALENDPLSLFRYASLGTFLGSMGQLDNIPSLIEEIETRFDDAEAYRLIAVLHVMMGEVDLAIAWTLRASLLEPENPDHVDQLADLFALIGDADVARQLQPSPNVGLLFRLRDYTQLIEVGGLRMIDEPGDIDVRFLLAFAYVATDDFDSAIYVLKSTGMPESILEDRARSVTEIEALTTLINALEGSGDPEMHKAAQSLAQWQEEGGWVGDVGWIGLYRGCNFAILGRHEEALAILARVKESPRLRRMAELRDFWCFRQYANEPVYQDVVADQEARREALREKLPATLKEFGLSF